MISDTLRSSCQGGPTTLDAKRVDGGGLEDRREAVAGDCGVAPPRHVLVSAYACEPGKGSEPGVGWNWVRHLGELCRVSVVTRATNRAAIEASLRDTPLPHVRFYYVDVPRRLRSWKRGDRGTYLYYVIWQRLALRVAARVLARDPFELAHHCTFASIHMPVFLHRLPVPLVYGPVGGGEMIDRAFWARGGARVLAYEGMRSVRMHSLRWDPVVRSTLRRAARILVTTPQTRRFVPERYRAKTSVMQTSGVQASSVRPRPRGHSSARRVYSAGRLVHWKGHHLAIRAFARVAHRYPDATFTILGDGPERARLERLIDVERLRDRVRLEAWRPWADATRLAEESDILLLPSLHDSGGVAVLEAMAAGNPVVCVDTGGPGVLVTAECGIKVPPTDPEQVVSDLASALDRLMSDPELCVRMGGAARQRVLDEFVWQKKAERMFSVYCEALTPGAGPRARRG